MRSIKVECKKLIFEVSEEVVLGCSWVLLQFFDRIWHCTSPEAFGVAKAIDAGSMVVQRHVVAFRAPSGLLFVACCRGEGPIEAVQLPMLSGSRHDVIGRGEMRASRRVLPRPTSTTFRSRALLIGSTVVMPACDACQTVS